MDPIRRNVLATGAAATATAAATRVFAQQAGPGAATTSFYEKGNIRIRYAETGSGFPLLVVPYQTSVDIASLAPNAEVTVYPWKDPPEWKARTINRVRTFLKAHQPATTAR
jgi:hypothetical protein